MLAIIGAAIATAIAVLWRVFRAGRQVERGRHAEAKNKGWADAEKLLGKAQHARRMAGRRAVTDLLSDDGYKRPGS